MFEIGFAEDVVRDIKELPANVRPQVLDAIDEQLAHEPTRATRNKKVLRGLKPPWDHEEPLWELRVGDYRVYHDVRENIVTVRAIRLKPPHRTTEETL